MSIYTQRTLSWEEWDKHVRALCAMTATRMSIKDFTPRGLIGIARGGVVAAAQVSHILGLPYLGTLQTFASGKDKVLKYEPINYPEDILFVDDIVDTGNTIRMLQEKYGERIHVLSPTGKPKGVNKYMTNLYVIPPLIVQDDVWLEFPWESEKYHKESVSIQRDDRLPF